MAQRFDKILELRKQRKKIWEEARAYREQHEKANEDGKLTAEEARSYQARLDDVEKLTTEIETQERELAVEERMLETEARRREESPDGSAQKKAEEYRSAFNAYLRGGFGSLNEEQRGLVLTRQQAITDEHRALAVGTDTAGGFTVPDEMYEGIIQGMKAFAGVRNTRADVVTTSTGRDMPYPTGNDTTNVGELLAENAQVNEQDTVFGSKNLRAYMFSSKMIRVPFQLLQDSVIDIEAYLRGILAERIGRATAGYFITGTGSNQPEGIVTGAPLGKTANASTAITPDELLDLIHSVDPAYRGNAEFMIGDSTLLALKKLKDSENRPLWMPGIALREPDTINGYRYVVDNTMPAMTAGNTPIVFGDMSYFKIRDVQGGMMMRLVERYADFGQVAFLAFFRHGSVFANPGTGPVKRLTMAA